MEIYRTLNDSIHLQGRGAIPELAYTSGIYIATLDLIFAVLTVHVLQEVSIYTRFVI